MTSLCTCVVCVRSFWDCLLFCFQTQRRGRSRASTRKTKSIPTFFDVCLSVYFEKEKREKLLAGAETMSATAVVAFVLLMHHYAMPRFFLVSTLLLSFSFHRPGFLLLSFLSFFLVFLTPRSPCLSLSLFPMRARALVFALFFFSLLE